MPPKTHPPNSAAKPTVLLMTTAPAENAAWILGKRLPPIGLMYVAAALEKAGYNVHMLDNYLLKKPVEEVKQLISKLQPQIVGITCGSATYPRCVETSRAIKEVNPDIKIVVGGWHASYKPDSLLAHPEIDYVVMGEGERAITQLADAIAGGNTAQIASIPGVGMRGKDGNIKNPPVYIQDMDEIPYPARHLLPLEQYDRTIEFLDAKPADVMSISRGCVFSCGFCETRKLWGNTWRGFSPKRVIGEIEDLKSRYGTRGIYFINDNFTLRKEKTVELCNLMIEKKLNLEWVCDTRVDLVTDELLGLMSKAGCRTIWFGVESASPRILKRIGRNTTPEQVQTAFKLAKKHGIKTACSFMLGLPDETLADMEASLKFAKKLDPDWCQFNTFIAYPDSKLYNELLESGKYTKLDEYLLSVKSDEYTYEDLQAIQRRFFKEFHMTPRQIYKRAKREGFLNFAKTRIFHGTRKASGTA
ncbi:MAG: B12-binding domain-containing radical SAM protein [Candidatus Bathyarchaeota archaeon]|nr:B12-binding domain-containing radical SAM protein [Candidatus Bathyarchaeota archaeon]